MPEAVIETSIGLFLVFTLLGRGASQIMEWIANRLFDWWAEVPRAPNASVVLRATRSGAHLLSFS